MDQESQNKKDSSFSQGNRQLVSLVTCADSMIVPIKTNRIGSDFNFNGFFLPDDFDYQQILRLKPYGHFNSQKLNLISWRQLKNNIPYALMQWTYARNNRECTHGK